MNLSLIHICISTVQDRIKRYQRAKAQYFTANTIEELAQKAGLPVETLVKVVNEYNQAVKAGKAAELTLPNTLENPRLIEKAPFYAFPFMGGMTATFGGPKITKKAEMLNTCLLYTSFALLFFQGQMP